MTEHYTVADFSFAVTLLEERDLDVLLPSFRSFRSKAPAEGDKLFELVEHASLPPREADVLLDEDSNDMGHTLLYRTPSGYRIELDYDNGLPHVVEFDEAVADVRAFIRWDDRFVKTALSSMLRIVFAQAILPRGAISVHASVVVNDSKGFLFMGKSGTGKSTHSRLWLKHIEGSWLLNDDNPMLRLTEGGVRVYGSPWSGKTHCYRNESAPVAGIVRLKQAPRNRFRVCEDIAAFSAVLPGCSVLRQDMRLHEALCETLADLTEMTLVGELECLPDREAAEVCRRGMATVIPSEAKG
ncbi:MAG: phosphoenolpyruvate carboxykinase [Bacteroidales bacterium]|nr:phosphoenolpyruvate carboxykinase [Bacteroidales bacterium]